MYKYEGYVQGFRWWGLKEVLWEAAHELEVHFKVVSHDKGLLRETIYFEVSSENEGNVAAFSRWLDRLVETNS